MNPLHALYHLAMTAIDEEDRDRAVRDIDGASGWLVHEASEIRCAWLAITVCSYHAKPEAIIITTAHVSAGDRRMFSIASTTRGCDLEPRKEIAFLGSLLDAISVLPNIQTEVALITVKMVEISGGNEKTVSELNFNPGAN